MAAHERLKNKFTEDKKGHDLFSWLFYQTCLIVSFVEHEIGLLVASSRLLRLSVVLCWHYSSKHCNHFTRGRGS